MSEKIEMPTKKMLSAIEKVEKKITKPKVVKIKPDKITIITEMQIVDYLQAHPNFFNDHVALLEKLSIPHATGGAVSLISKQLELFRTRYQDMENQLTELIEIARDNDTAVNRMHKLNLALHDAISLEEVVSNLNIVLTEYFLADFIAIRLIQTPTPNFEHLDSLFITPESKELKSFENELRTGRPTCGKPTLTQARILFGFQANEVKSCAIVPMLFTGLEGLLAIGSCDEKRFHSSMGHLFLTQMSEVIATRLIALI